MEIKQPKWGIFKDEEAFLRLIELRQKGWSYKKLATYFGLKDHTTIKHHCKRVGVIPLTTKVTSFNAKNYKITTKIALTEEERIEKMCDLYSRGLTLKEVAKKFNFSTSVAEQILRDRNIFRGSKYDEKFEEPHNKGFNYETYLKKSGYSKRESHRLAVQARVLRMG